MPGAGVKTKAETAASHTTVPEPGGVSEPGTSVGTPSVQPLEALSLTSTCTGTTGIDAGSQSTMSSMATGAFCT